MERLDAGQKIALDTNLFIYLIEKNQNYFPTVKLIFDKIQKGQLIGVTSSLIYTEVLSNPLKEGNTTIANKYNVLLATFPNLIIKDVDKDIAIISAKLRAKYNIKTPDAVFIATGIAENADTFITNDDQLKKIEEIKVTLLNQINDN
ncbi:type II toxin-antitoxin system VapC family toxin [Aceticella autotrophica]|uniref:Type II toxin-antitoxin system VapC family toxin n=1 Tax=Aceticella autotrophica TaxID=2755338 RepID=A0A974Y2L4_9THEO|nr:type II toxin-antitoxin system VapC family toxin [Aceticella autotrophica]QSZ26448.1 type II toxin-antitoxin system VapC family toxin [Aceticella autotrophica]